MAVDRLLRGAVHGHPRPQHRQRRVAVDPVEPGLFGLRIAMGRRRLRDHLRGLSHARRPRGRPIRPAAHIRRRRARIRAGLADRWGGREPERARRRPRAPGPRRRPDGGLLAGHHHLDICPRPGAQSGDRAVGGDERPRRGGGHAVRRPHHPGAELALGTAHQPADRRRHGSDRLRRHPRAARGAGAL